MNPSKAMEGVFNEYSINERCLRKKYHIPKTDYDKLSIVMIYLNKEYDINDDKHDLTEMLYILFQANMPAEDKKYQLSENYGIMMTRAIDKEMTGVCNLSQGIMDKGIEKGLEKGRAEGLEQGRIAGLSEAVMNTIEITNMPITEVMNALKIDEEVQPEIIKYINSLNQ